MGNWWQDCCCQYIMGSSWIWNIFPCWLSNLCTESRDESYKWVMKYCSRTFLWWLAKVKIDRIPSFTHWGRIDTRTGVDQRAEVGLLSRNVRFYGELDHSKGCQYAFTREQLSQSSVNHVCERSPAQCEAAGITNGEKALDWGCNYYKEVNGEDKDRHPRSWIQDLRLGDRYFTIVGLIQN